MSFVFVFVLLTALFLESTIAQNEQCSYSSSGLFYSDQESSSLNMGSNLFFPQSDSVYRLRSYKKQFTFKETCGRYERVTSPQKGVKLLSCGTSQSQTYGSRARAKRALQCQGCCSTEMSISIPGTVTNMYDGVSYDAKHFPASYQLLNLGHCSTPGGPCGHEGTCTQAYRIDWILVETPGGDMFVPTSVPSHCTCVYS